MAVSKLFVVAVAALSLALPVVSAPIPRFDATDYQGFHSHSRHVAIANYKRDLAARSSEHSVEERADSGATSSDDGDDDTCSDTDSEDGDDDEECPEGYESVDDDDEDDATGDCDGPDTEDDVDDPVKQIDQSTSGTTTLNAAPTTTTSHKTTATPAKKTTTTKTSSATPTPTKKASSNNASSSGKTSSSSGETFTGFGTFYYQNGVAGACGKVNPDSAIIGAMNTSQFKGSCGKHIQITSKKTGKTATVLIADECPSCGRGDVDLSVGAFKSIDSNLDDGRIDISWSFLD